MEQMEKLKIMGINSYISHRMYVAALSHDEASSAKTPHPRRMEDIARNIAAKIPWHGRLSTMTSTKTSARHWPMSPTPGGN